jgi:hypothetical protein
MVHKIGLEKGTKVWVEPTPKGLQESYPATEWLKKKMKVELLEYSPHGGTLDVVDVKLPCGKIESIYDFNIKRKAKK